MIEFAKEFFQGEEREGFYVEPMMKRVWASQMEVLQDFDKVCRNNNIQYFASWGTLLGAIRHKGFIPWDDDIDISMKRKDYAKFLTVADQLPSYYEVVNIYTDEDYTNMITRVINGREVTLEDWRMKNFHNCPYVCGLDIDILDYKVRDNGEDEVQLKIIEIVLRSVQVLDEYKEGKHTYEELQEILTQVEQLCGTNIDYNKNIGQQLRILGDQLCMLYRENESVALHNPIYRVTDDPEYVMPKEWFSKAVYVPFENIEIPVPIGHRQVLRQQYGEDYMTPKIVYNAHEYPYYRDQEKMLVKFLEDNHLTMEQFMNAINE